MSEVTNSVPLSLEFFPPRDAAAQERLVRAAKQLQALNPEYISVTFGAGGSTRSGTIETVSMMKNLGFDAAPHLSCVGSSRSFLSETLDTYKQLGIRRVVALRGDIPSGMGGDSGELHYANELVEFIRKHSGDWFHIEVAAYPEVHPQAISLEADLDFFVQKVNAGANAAITQYFFNADAYYDFVERASAKGVSVPIVPGIMPITNFKQLQRFSNMCGAEIPRWLVNRLVDYADDKASLRAFGLDFVSKFTQNLIENGAPGVHIYTLNNASVTTELVNRISPSLCR